MERAFIPEKKFMLRALALADEACADGEVPVGAVVVKAGKIIGEGRNRRERMQNALAHAEIEAIFQACKALRSWRLTDCHLYVTLEPCPMCTGAIINAQIGAVIYGAEDTRAGCCGGAENLFDLPYAARPEVYPGFLEDECRAVLQNFFKALRKQI